MIVHVISVIGLLGPNWNMFGRWFVLGPRSELSPPFVLAAHLGRDELRAAHPKKSWIWLDDETWWNHTFHGHVHGKTWVNKKAAAVFLDGHMRDQGETISLTLQPTWGVTPAQHWEGKGHTKFWMGTQLDQCFVHCYAWQNRNKLGPRPVNNCASPCVI